MTNAMLPLVQPPPTSIPIGRRFALSAAGDLRIILLEQQPVIEFHGQCFSLVSGRM
jgi:hypothetical protein